MIDHASRRRVICRRVDTRMRSRDAAARCAIERQDAHDAVTSVVATISEVPAEGRRPFRREVGIHRDDVAVTRAEVRASDHVDRAVRRDRGRDIYARPLRAAGSGRDDRVRRRRPRQVREAKGGLADVVRCRRASHERRVRRAHRDVAADFHEP